MSCNTSQLKLDESEPEEMGDIHKLKQDLYGVETDFKYDFRFDKPVGPLKIEERNMRVAKARLRLRQRKVFAEDNLGAPQQKMITYNDEIPPSPDRENSAKKVRLDINADEPSQPSEAVQRFEPSLQKAKTQPQPMPSAFKSSVMHRL